MKAFIILLALALPSAALAQAVCGESGACSNEETNFEYKECLNKLAEAQDRELNRLYGQVRELFSGYDAAGSLAPKLVPAFKEAQRAWIAFRDRQCAVEYNIAQGGTAGGGYGSECLCQLTYQRNLDLKRILNSYGSR
jgi:uncharacterized protein YecT (DUF1311 family)